MGFVTPYLLIDFVLVVGVVVYAYFRWAFGYWERRGLAFLEPQFPNGTLDDPFRRKRTIGKAFKIQSNIQNLFKKKYTLLGLTQKQQYNKLKARNLKHGGTYIFTKPIYMLADPEIIKNVLSKDFDHFTDRGFYHNEKVIIFSLHVIFVFNLTILRLIH